MYPTTIGDENADQSGYLQEMAELKLTELGGQIRLRGHWEISIRPESYEENRLEYGDIYPAVVSGYTRHQHWDFPSIAGEADAKLGARWKGEEYESDYAETWRMYESGQFTCLMGLQDDLNEDEVSAHQGVRLSVEDLFSLNQAVTWVTGVFEVDANLFNAYPNWPSSVVETRAVNIFGRSLANRRGLLSGSSRTESDQWGDILYPSRDALTSDPHNEAAQFLDELF